MESRTLLAGLIGVDFGGAGNIAPTNWRAETATSVPTTISNLIDESSAATTVDLSYTGSANFAAGNDAVNANTIPAHSNSLSQIGGKFSASSGPGTQTAQFVFQDLRPFASYQVYVFGLSASTGNQNQVSIAGAGLPATFTQNLTAGNLFINGALGSNASLANFAVEVQADTSGQITIDVGTTTFWSLAGLAIQEITTFDFGDAATSAQSGFPNSYPTLLSNNGARHEVTGPRLGANIDPESDGQPHFFASGDDFDGNDDEDGVTFGTLIAGAIASVSVDLQNADPTSNRLDAWMDFNRDGDWLDAGEKVFDNVNLGTTSGVKSLTFVVPASASINVTHARFRLSTAGNLPPTGAAANGEVEDYEVTITDASFYGVDYGDAPDPSYPTRVSSSGAGHVAREIFLGATRDTEFDGQPNSTATGDGADEDGVVFASSLIAGQSVSINVTASGAGVLNAWIDLNGDGDWTDSAEQIFVNVPLAAGLNSLATTLPAAGINPNPTYARFRLSSIQGLTPTGLAPDGEVEDYRITVTIPFSADEIGVARSGIFLQDANANGVWNGAPPDRISYFGATTDLPIVGDWNGDGIDEIGAYRPASATYYLDVNGNGQWDGAPLDRVVAFGGTNDRPIVGDWNGDGIDEIGVFRPATATFYLDVNGNGQWDGVPTDAAVAFGAGTDSPAIGDWNGDGVDDVGVFRGSTATFYRDTNGNRQWNSATDLVNGFGAVNDRPLIGDWNNDQRDDIGVYRGSVATFYRDLNGNGRWDNVSLDSAIAFGALNDTPLAGNWSHALRATGEPVSGGVARLTIEELSPIVNAAIDVFADLGLDAARIDVLRNTTFYIDASTGPLLGFTSGNVIVLSGDAAGYGWYVGRESRDERREPEDSAAGSGLSTLDPRLGMDLLTVVLHELGHVLGLDDDYSLVDPAGVMNGWLQTGLRRLPTAGELALLAMPID